MLHPPGLAMKSNTWTFLCGFVVCWVVNYNGNLLTRARVDYTHGATPQAIIVDYPFIKANTQNMKNAL